MSDPVRGVTGMPRRRRAETLRDSHPALSRSIIIIHAIVDITGTLSVKNTGRNWVEKGVWPHLVVHVRM